jgi:hypothetical protein
MKDAGLMPKRVIEYPDGRTEFFFDDAPIVGATAGWDKALADESR